MTRRDPRVPDPGPEGHPPLPDWDALDVPVLEISDFLHIPRGLVGAYVLGRKVRRKLHTWFSRSNEMILPVFDFKLCVALDSKGIELGLGTTGWRELDHRYLIQRLLKPNMVVCDVGANIGYYVAMYGTLMKDSGFIYAVEPDPRNIARLRKNIELNGLTPRVQVDAIALSDHDGELPFHLADSPNLSGLQTSTLSRSYVETIEVPVRDLGGYLG